MALVKHIQTAAKLVRPLSTNIKHGQDVQKSIFISQSNDVYTNLALEEWMNTNMDFEKMHVMLYYKNEPCVVLGKNENPWLDTNISSQHETDQHQEIALARRQTHSSTQYHDQGTMNLTFFGQDVEHEYNLGIISRGMFRKYGLNVNQTGNNLSFYNMKLTSSGDKISTTDNANSYQNCSLFVDINKKNMKQAMSKDKIANNTNNYLNISEIDPHVNTNGLLSAIGWEFMRTVPYTLKDGGKELANQQLGFHMINPTDEWFPGLKEIRNRLVNWDWCYGKTPKFSIFRTFQVPQALLNNPSDSNELRVKLDVDNGKISDISLVVPPGLLTSGYTGEAQIITDIKGQKFSEETLKKIENFLGLEKCHNEREKFVTECVKKAMVI